MPFIVEKDPGLIPKILTIILDECINGVTLADPDIEGMPIVYVNKAFEKMTGYSQEEIVGRNCRFLQGEDREQAERYKLAEAIQNRVGIEVTLRNYKKNGELFYNRLKLSPLFDNQGKLLYFLGVQHDVTELMQAESKIKQLYQQLQQ